jgi:PAS domain S-box-containing protein
MNETLDKILENRYLIIALSIAMLGGFIIIAQTIKEGKKWLSKIMQPPKPVGQEYIDLSMIKLFDDNIAAAGVVSDSNGKILWVNGWATHVLRWRKDEMIGKSMDMLLQDKSRTIYNQMTGDYKNKGYSENLGKPIRMQCLSKGQIALPVEITIVAAQDNNRILFIAKIRDITQQLEEFTVLQRQLDLYKKVEEDACIGLGRWDWVEDKVYMTDNMLSLFDLDIHSNNCSNVVLTNCIVSTDRKRINETIISAINKKAKGYEAEYTLRNGRYIREASTLEYNENEEITFVNRALRELKQK